VRNLAQRSAAAAREVKTLIGNSVEQVAAGARHADEAWQERKEIVQSVQQVSGLIAEIAAACQEQSSGLHQVNDAVTQMDQVVQQNASLVEEAAAATEAMNAQAEALLQAGQYEGAAELYRRVLVYDAANARARAGMELIETDRRHRTRIAEADKLARQERYREAEDVLRPVLTENPQNREARRLQRAIEEKTVKPCGSQRRDHQLRR